MSKTKRRHTDKNKTKKSKKKWVSAIVAAQRTLTKTGSLQKAQKQLQITALANARRMFGSVGEQL